MYIVSYSERSLTLGMTFRANTDVTNEALNEVSTLRYEHIFERFKLRTSGFNLSFVFMSHLLPGSLQ